MSHRIRFFAPYLVLLIATCGFAQESSVADPPKPTEKEAESAECEGCGLDVIPENLKDAGFERYMSPEHIREAYYSMDALWMTDIALMLAEGERVLGRSHLSGVSADGIMEIAGKIAVETGDKDSLERLAKSASALDKSELATKFETLVKGIDGSRAADVDMEKYDYLARLAKMAKIVGGNDDLVDVVAKSDMTKLSEKQKKHLEKLLSGARAAGEDETENKTAEVLAQLSFVARPSERLFFRNRIPNSLPLEPARIPRHCNLGTPAINDYFMGWAGQFEIAAGNPNALLVQALFSKPINRSDYRVAAVPISANHPNATDTPLSFITHTSDGLDPCDTRSGWLSVRVAQDAPQGTFFRVQLQLYLIPLSTQVPLSRYTLPHYFEVVAP